MNILFFAIGSSTLIHTQAFFALRTAYIHAEEDDSIFIMTDSPALYQNLPFVNIETITEDEIVEWRGENNYFFRVKINAIKKFISLHSDQHLLYMDCDTYVHDSLKPIKSALNCGIGVMHKDEGFMTNMKGASGVMWQQTKGKTFHGITIEEKHHMWNSGVYGIPRQYLSDVLQTSLCLCDAFLAEGVTCFNMEQWGGAIALMQFTGSITPAYKYIGHYWHPKETWLKYISDFFLESYRHGRSLSKELEAIKKTDFSLLEKKLYIKRSINKLLHKL